MNTTTVEQRKAVFQIVAAVSEAIRELGEVPNGHLYAQLMSRLNLATYTKIIDTLKMAGLVQVKNDLIIWIGPKF